VSIRLRLTLLYSLILALTLVIFSGILYMTQARATMTEAKRELAKRAEFIVNRPSSHRSDDDRPPPVSRTRIGTIFEVRTPDGEVLDRSPNLEDAFTLPLSEAGLQAVQRGQTWVEIGSIESERLLIQSQLSTSNEAGVPLIVQVAVSLADRDQSLVTLGNLLIVGSSLVVIAAFGIGWALAGLTLRPISRLRQTAQAIGAERDFGRRVDYTGGPNDEIGQLAATFNDMLTELQAAYLHVEETLQAHRRFVADASHELRTPLTTLRGNIELLQREPPISGEDRTDVLADMVDETERLMRLVHELLALARADARRPLQHEPVQLKPLLEDVRQQVKLLAPRRAIIYQADPEMTVIGDGDALRQVLLALLDNAVKYTPPEATVTISAAQHDGQITIQVSDDGPGIAPEHLPHLFDRFYRGDATRTSSGTGLGLAIADELTKAQHGTITVESKPGEGSTFTLIFPPG
jgi:two-component system OmpR family sensor kinase